MKRRTAELSADDLETLARSPDEGLRVKAALHPHTPLATLLSLAADQAIGVRRALARRTGAPREVLARLARDPTRAVRCAVAAHPGCDEPLRRLLWTDGDGNVRAIAKHAAAIPHHFSEDLARIARNEAVPASVLAEFAELGGQARCAVASHRECPRGWLERFRHDADAAVRLVAETRMGLSLDTLRAFARHRSPSYRVAAAASLPWDDAEMPALLADSHEPVLLALLRRPDFPAAFYAQITDNPPPVVRLVLATHEALDAAHLQRLLRDPRADVRRRVAQRRALSAEQFAALANDDDDRVKRELAKRPDCPEAWLRRWCVAPSEWLRRVVFTHPGVTPDILVNASALPDNHEEIAKHPLTPEKLLAQLADSAGVFVRGAVAQNPSTPERVLSQLARDADSYVRLQVGRNETCPLSLLLDLEHDPDFVVRRHIVWRADCPLDILRRRAADENAHVRYAVADHRQATAEVLSGLARDGAMFVRARAKERLSGS
ncbi:hypothetical protein [Sorangium atrum]|uniref:Leucine rich repeat variant n=1 Tax=Sorangium atrum TaxID=2995308 RepID=A0ABT5BYZ7_9BACT|nr:hypothetical protein [Sorangium aterium]MDC0678963.1 hypothetical protein [Sorangium aterium]